MNSYDLQTYVNIQVQYTYIYVGRRISAVLAPF